MSHLTATTGLEFLLKYPGKIDCSFFLSVFLLIGFSLLIFYHVFVLLPGYKHSSQQQQLADACDLYIKEYRDIRILSRNGHFSYKLIHAVEFSLLNEHGETDFSVH